MPDTLPSAISSILPNCEPAVIFVRSKLFDFFLGLIDNSKQHWMKMNHRLPYKCATAQREGHADDASIDLLRKKGTRQTGRNRACQAANDSPLSHSYARRKQRRAGPSREMCLMQTLITGDAEGARHCDLRCQAMFSCRNLSIPIASALNVHFGGWTCLPGNEGSLLINIQHLFLIYIQGFLVTAPMTLVPVRRHEQDGLEGCLILSFH